MPVAFVQDLQDNGIASRASSGCGSSCPAGAYFAALSSRLNSACSNRTGSDLEHRQIGGKVDLDAMLRQDLARRAAARCRRSRRGHAARRSARSAPDSSLVMSSRLAMNRLSRSDFVDDGREQIGLLGFGRACRKDRAACRQRPSTAASGVLRSCEIEVSSAERSRSVSTVRLTRSMSSTRCDALDRQRALVDQRIEQAALIGREQRPRLVAVDADNADGAAAGPHRQEQPLGARQRIRAAPGGAIVLPGPFRGGEVGIVEDVLRRIAGLDRDRAVLGQQQARRAPSASARSDRRSPTARRRACRRRRACG